ncbi:MAG TPA: YraN family protein [Methylophilus sp.]|nr:YraN family protein [Methylophilus sp.]HQQ33820.1 YraN family protein [Methylophilus sp.]
MKLNKNNAGLDAEHIAATFLQSKGLKLIAQNYHCRFGEIDLVMQDGKTLVFVEVRMRSNARFGSAASSITPQKQQKLILTAQHYLQQHGEQPCRFDAIAMTAAQPEQIEWICNAFSA